MESGNVYTSVPDTGQECISVCWVISPKLVDGIWKVKAGLVTRGFEEDVDRIRSDSPTCLRESLQILLGAIENELEISLFRQKMCISTRISDTKKSFCRTTKKGGAIGCV